MYSDNDFTNNLAKKLVSMLIQDLRQYGYGALIDLVKKSEYTLEYSYHDNWDGGIDFYYLVFYLPIGEYSKLVQKKEEYENILNSSVQSFYSNNNIRINGVKIEAKMAHYIDWVAIQPRENKNSVLTLINAEKDTLIKAGTGLIQIKDTSENEAYKTKHKYLCDILLKLGLSPIHEYTDLWDWYNDYKNRGLTTYQSRREYISKLFEPLINTIENSEECGINLLHYEKTGWDKIDDDLLRMREVLETAHKTQDYQTVGMHGRELLITLAQTVFIKEKHPSVDGIDISETDSKRMLDAYIAFCLKNKSREREAKFAKAAVDFSNELTHKRTAVSMDAELCYTAVLSTVHIIRILYKYNSQ